MSELPKGWVEAPLVDVTDILDAIRKPVSNKERMTRIADKAVTDLYPYYGATGQAGTIDDYLFDEELVALGEDGVPFFDGKKHKAYMLYGKTWVNNHAHVLRGTGGYLVNKYLCEYLNQFDYMGYVNGGTRLKLTQANMKRIPIPLAPLAEQKRIVEKLDEVLAQVDTIKARLDGIPALLKRFRQSVLASAVSGKLTEEWRKDNSSEFPDVNTISQELFDDGTTKGNFGNKSARAEAIKDDELQKYKSIYPLIRVGEVSGCIVPNRDKPKTFSGDTPWILTPYLNDQSIELRSEQIELGLSSSEIELYNARVIPSDSVIMTCVGRLGLSAVNEFKCIINQQLHAFTCGKHIYSRYLAFSIRAMENYFCSAATSTTVQYLNKTACNSMPLPLPSIEEQKEIVRLVDQYFAFADTIEAQVKKAQARVDNLTQSILAKAFRGELVPQDPNDEPADKLLERIAQARKEAEALAKAAKKAQSTKSTAKKKVAKSV
ncbi:restriction endonuclease subunit S [Vibrio harveyi]|uniref:restriction endonuclease subunit S n=1 Tax=Vibrio harveyi TaxID=669 RepID=UPI001C95DE0C|nr:restriction endonuclease subunit S [Vibrio harveyi]MBY6234673.1 restriction endonuclease subunit S [Vibrio harveyi]